MSDGYNRFRLSYEITPIIFTGGIADSLPGGMLPIVSLTQAQDYAQGILSGGSDIELDDHFCHFVPMAGATLADNQIGQYPFANQSIAANAIITQPLRISMLMIVPVRSTGGYVQKQAIMSSLQSTIAQHNIAGGTYTVATPSFIFTSCIMTAFRDVSGGESKQAQDRWQFDFMQPLLTLEAATQAQNTQMQKISAGVQLSGDPPSPTAAAAVGAPSSLVAPAIIPAARSPSGTSVSGQAVRQ